MFFVSPRRSTDAIKQDCYKLDNGRAGSERRRAPAASVLGNALTWFLKSLSCTLAAEKPALAEGSTNIKREHKSIRSIPSKFQICFFNARTCRPPRWMLLYLPGRECMKEEQSVQFKKRLGCSLQKLWVFFLCILYLGAYFYFGVHTCVFSKLSANWLTACRFLYQPCPFWNATTAFQKGIWILPPPLY